MSTIETLDTIFNRVLKHEDKAIHEVSLMTFAVGVVKGAHHILSSMPEGSLRKVDVAVRWSEAVNLAVNHLQSANAPGDLISQVKRLPAPYPQV